MTTALEYTTIEHDDRSFRLADVGAGPPIVLLHGFPDTPDSWADFVEPLQAAGMRVIVPYLRGYHPDTVVPGRGYGRAEIGADVVDLLDALSIDRAVVVGHDWGASCAWSAYAQAPERLAGLGAIAIPHPAALKPSPRLMWAVRHFGYFKAPGAETRTARGNLGYIDTLYDRWAPSWTGPGRVETQRRAKETLGDPLVLHHALEWYRALSLKPDPANDFRVDCPGLLIAGGDDFGGNLEAYEASVAEFDGPAELLVVEGAGHWPHRENTPLVSRRLTEFAASCFA